MVNRIEKIINCPEIQGRKRKGDILNSLKMTKSCFIAAAIALLAVFVAAPAGAGDLNWKLRGDYTYNVAGNCAHAVCGQVIEANCCVSPGNPVDCDSTKPCKYDCGSEANCCVSPGNPVGCASVVQPCTWGFNPATLALRVPGKQKSYSYNIQAVINFNGRGNFTLNGEVLVVRNSLGTAPPDIPANQLDLDCDGTYKVDSVGNGLFVDMTFAVCIGKITSGLFGAWGFTQKISGPVIVRGRLDTVTGSSSVIISNTLKYMEELEVTACPGYPGLVGMKEQRICHNTGSIVKLSPRNNWFLNK